MPVARAASGSVNPFRPCSRSKLAPTSEGHYLTIQHCRDVALTGHRVRDLGEGAFEGLVVAGAQSYLS